MQVMMSSVFTEKQHKQEITVVEFRYAFESIMFFNQTLKMTSYPDNMKWRI